MTDRQTDRQTDRRKNYKQSIIFLILLSIITFIGCNSDSRDLLPTANKTSKVGVQSFFFDDEELFYETVDELIENNISFKTGEHLDSINNYEIVINNGYYNVY